MSEPEHSYYEIALTNRQALVAFAVLLGVVLVAFFAGVWVAREGGPSRVEVVEAPESEVAPVGTTPLRPEPKLERVSTAAEPSTTLVEDVTGRRPAAPSTASAPGPAATAEGEPADPDPVLARAAEPEVVGLPSPATKASPAPSTTPRSEPSKVPSVAPAPAATDGSVVVQVLATADRAKAEGLVKRLEAAGYAAFLSPIGVGAERTYRVRIGPFATRDAALPVQARVDRQFKVESWITTP